MPEIQLRTPLVAVADLPYQGHDIEIRELPGQGYMNLRGDASQRAFTEAVQGVCGVALPGAANT
ncbi:MAG: hypothetical protein OET44_06775, partial [Gammaproteobacteria bacterium]|nr:hypothetical protein [Gammaproteobacteria bacterium]